MSQEGLQLGFQGGEGAAPMPQLRFQRFRHFRKGELRVRHVEDRVVAKAAITASFRQDLAGAVSFHLQHYLPAGVS